MSANNPAQKYTYNGRVPHKEDAVAIAVSEYHTELTEALYEGARQILNKYNVLNINKLLVPGSFELPFGCKQLALTERFNAVIAFGVVIRGDTNHDRYINHAIAQHLMDISLTTSVPIINGVVTTENLEQAKARCGGEVEHKGKGCAVAALKMIDMVRNLQEI